MKSKNSRTIKAMFGLVFSIIALSFSLSYGYAQGKVLVDGMNINDQPIEYITIKESGRGPIGKIAVAVDYGQKDKFELIESQVITSDDKKPMGFESLVGALNFMCQNGWEFVSVYTVITGGGTTNNQTEVYYLLRKRKP